MNEYRIYVDKKLVSVCHDKATHTYNKKRCKELYKDHKITYKNFGKIVDDDDKKNWLKELMDSI